MALNHAGELHQEAARAKAERIIAEELQCHGWQEQDLVCRRKNDPTKLEIAARLRRETTLSVKEIAARAHLGTSKRRTPNCTNTCAARPQTTQRKHVWVSEPMKRSEEERTKLWVAPWHFQSNSHYGRFNRRRVRAPGLQPPQNRLLVGRVPSPGFAIWSIM